MGRKNTTGGITDAVFQVMALATLRRYQRQIAWRIPRGAAMGEAGAHINRLVTR